MSEQVLHGVELRSTVTRGGELRLTLEPVEIGSPGLNEVVVRIEAAPVNPSDIGLLLGQADLSTARHVGTGRALVLAASVPEEARGASATRFDQSLSVGNEAAGTVVAAGENAKTLLGKIVALSGGGMYTRYRRLAAKQCIPLPVGATPADGAAITINPLTALAMVETMRREGHSALVHTAAASNLGLMLNRICITDGVRLVNVVRSAEQVQRLQMEGAALVVDSSAANFRNALTEAIAASGATIAFDAVGGGSLANSILHAMEDAAKRNMTEFSRYGSTVHKQVYIYGSLNSGGTELDRGYGMAWGVGAFLLTPFLQQAGPELVGQLRERVLRELTTTFASKYTAKIGLDDLLKPNVLRAVARRATGEKYLVDPQL